MLPTIQPPPGGFYSDELDTPVRDEGVEDSHRVRSAANAGDDAGRKPPGGLEHLRLCLAADHGLEIPNHPWVGRRPHHRADDVVAVGDVGYPIADCLAGRILERAGTGEDGDDLGAHQSHPIDVEL